MEREADCDCYQLQEHVSKQQQEHDLKTRGGVLQAMT